MHTYTDSELKKIDASYKSFIESISHVMDSEQIGFIDKAYHLALKSFDGRRTISGKLYVLSLIEMAAIAANEIGLRSKTIVGIFLQDVIHNQTIDLDYIKENFGERIALIIEGYEKISNVQTNKLSFQSEQFRRLYLSLIDDIRVLLIKIIHRIYDMRHKEDVDSKQFVIYLREVKYLYIPILHRLGMYEVKKELEEKLMIYENPEEFEEIKNKIRVTAAEQEKLMEDFLAPIRQALSDEHIEAQIKWRTKSIPSIYEKMKSNNLPFEQIFDIFAVRIIIKNCKRNEEKTDCWRVYSLVTNIYQPNPKRLRDWITTPKVSGYESLHTTVKAGNKWIEVQIRTERMDEIAEKGSAAHWQYKGKDKKQTTDEWLNQIREILETPNFGNNDEGLAKSCKSDKIYVFTPNGDLKQLPIGATVLDFAFDIHTQLGCHCSGANVNGKIQSIKYQLNSGDRVEVIINKKQVPKPDWLSIVTTDKAKNRIKRYLKDLEMKEAELGSALFFRRLKNWKIPYTEKLLNEILKNYNLSSGIELYHLIATEEIDISDLKDFIFSLADSNDSKSAKVEDERNKDKPNDLKTKELSLSLGADVNDLAYKIAKCCNPHPGDEMYGFITISGGVTLHRADCNNLKSLRKNYPYRIIDVRWSNEDSVTTNVTIKIIGNNELGLLSSISSSINEMRINILNANFVTENNKFTGELVLQMHKTINMEQLIRKIKSQKGIIEVHQVK